MQKRFTAHRSHRHKECVTVRAPHTRSDSKSGELTEWPQLTVDKVERLLQSVKASIPLEPHMT